MRAAVEAHERREQKKATVGAGAKGAKGGGMASKEGKASAGARAKAKPSDAAPPIEVRRAQECEVRGSFLFAVLYLPILLCTFSVCVSMWSARGIDCLAMRHLSWRCGARKRARCVVVLFIRTLYYSPISGGNLEGI